VIYIRKLTEFFRHIRRLPIAPRAIARSVVALLALSLLAPALAAAASPTAAQYGSTLHEFRPEAGNAGAGNAGAALPFTGLDLGLLVLAGVALLAAGLVLRRMRAAPGDQG
jgi:hypothetical protein